MEQYDLAVLGGGPGGYVAALRAAGLGLKTVLVEKDKVGGTCLNRGCIPTKSLLESAQTYQTVLKAGEQGIRVSGADFDYAGMAKRKDAVVARLVKGIEALLKKAGVAVIRGEGALAADRTILVDGKPAVQAGKIIVATGSVPAIPPIPGSDLPGVVNSDALLAMDKAPKSLVVIGGGVIGIEFAGLFADLGVPVTVLEALPSILAGMDGEVVKTLVGALKKKKVTIRTSAKVLEIAAGGELTVTFEEGGERKTASGELVLVATGRKASLAGLEHSGLALERGCVAVDERLRTNLPGVFAIGDCTGKAQLAHVASAQGAAAAQNAAGRDTAMRYDIVPACVYTAPEIACVGLSEEAARASGRAVGIGRFPVAANGKSMILGETAGFAKIVADTQTGEILGAHIVSPRATDIIGELAAVMRAEGTMEELAETIHPHPTVAEIVMEAAHDFAGASVHKF